MHPENPFGNAHEPWKQPESDGTKSPYETPVGPLPGWRGTSPDERTWGMLVHLTALSGCIIPFGNFVVPLVIWLTKKDSMPFVDDQGKESLNFQITTTFASLVAILTLCIGIGVVLIPLVLVLGVVFVIIAAVKANQGIAYRYPLNIRLIS